MRPHAKPMSDLSQPPLSASSGQRSEDRTSVAPSLWAMPPAANAGTSWPLGTSEPCAILGLNDKSFNARMAQFDASTGLAIVFVPPARAPMQLRFGQFQRLTLTEPVMPSSNGVNAAPGWADRVPGDTEFQVQLTNGKSHTGRTIGHVETEQGLFLFPPIGDAGLIQRSFYPRGAYRRVDFGPRLGDVLVRQHTLSPQQLQHALAEQQRIRNLKLGEMLVEVELITQAQLAQALELQSRTPMLRLEI